MTAPVLQWTGGKRRLLTELLKEMPGAYNTYYEPFSGGLALFFALYDLNKFKSACLADMNPDLINFYTYLRDEPQHVIAFAIELSSRQSEEHYYEVRASTETRGALGAARMLYLNRTCFNALWRVNKSGGFNVPWGKKIKANIVDSEALLAAARALQRAEIAQLDCLETIACAESGDLVYADPPYYASSGTSNFVAYTAAGFDNNKQRQVSEAMLAAAARGARVVISNADTPTARQTYAAYSTRTLDVMRTAGCKNRGKVSEIIASAGVVRV